MNSSKQIASTDEKNEFTDPILYRKQQLAFNTPILEMPADFRRTSTISCQVDQISFSISSGGRDAIKQLSGLLDSSLFCTLLAVYNTLLFRYTNKEDILIGLPPVEEAFNKTKEPGSAVYYTKVYLTDLATDRPFDELLKCVHQEVVKGNGANEMPYDEFHDVMTPAKGIGCAGSYNVIFSYRNAEAGVMEFNEWVSKVCVPEKYRDAIELGLCIEETSEGLMGTWMYNSELFGAAAVEGFAKHFEVLLESVSSNPKQVISKLQLLSVQEYNQLSAEWNSSKVAYPSDKCIHELFEEQAAKTPNAPAVIFGKQKLSYAKLNERANQLAHYLRSKGVRQETLVPICIDRSPEMIIGILGILKAGGTYVPIDPKYPSERIAYLLADTGASIVICNVEYKGKLHAFPNVDVIELNGEDAFLKIQPASNLTGHLSSKNLAYVIYTSGTTGKPKGVMIEHRALADHCYGVIESAGLKVCKSFALFSPLVFDAGHSIIHSCFILGACLHILSDEFILDGGRVKTYLNDNAIDCIKIVPSRWLSYASLKMITLPKKVIIFGGEVFPLSIINYLKKSNYHGNIYNHYGPTEVTIGKCIYKVDINKSYHSIPIGRPYSNTQLYVLDNDLQIVPTGIEGELYIAGDGLARGYLNQADLTNEKFVKNPFAANSSGRMYKTGDKVRWLSDGNIEYLGRGDEQVKIKGHRIEPGEIEEVMLASGLVQHAVVLAPADNKGNKRLEAFIVPNQLYSKEALLAFLRNNLPEYMVPVSCIEIETLPITGNGKINKKKLEDLEAVNKKFTAPKGEIEEKLATIWRDLLHIDKISIHDNFFELGGNSIHAAALFARIKRKFHESFPLTAILEAPTVYQLAVAIKEKSSLLSSSSLVPIQPNGSKPPLFCIHAGGGDVVFYGNLSLLLGKNQPFYGLQAKGIDGLELPFAEMEHMASYYIRELRKVQPEGPYYLAGYCLGARIAFEMAQQLTNEGQKVALLVSFNGISPAYVRSPNLKVDEKSPGIFVKVSLHLDEITKLNLNEKILYIPKKVLKRVIYKLREPIYQLIRPFFELKYQLSGVIFRLCIFAKQKVPAKIARMFVDHSLFKLQCKYKPKVYSGSMVIFRSPKQYTDPYLGWSSFVKGGIKTFDVPGVHRTRRDIMNEPHVRHLADELKKFLI